MTLENQLPLDYDTAQLGFLLDQFMVDFKEPLHNVKPGYMPLVICPSYLLITEELKDLPKHIKPHANVTCQILSVARICEDFKLDTELLENIHRVLMNKFTPMLMLLESGKRTRALVIPLLYNLKHGKNPQA